jgi:hypothetical protein
MSHKYITKVVQYIFVQLSSLNNTMSMGFPLRRKGYGGQAGVSVQVSAFLSLASRFWLLASSQGPGTSYETPGRNSEQIERRTSNIDDATLYRF